MNLHLSRAELEARVWTFGLVDATIGRQVRLLPDGRISGYAHENEAAWDLRDGVLTLLNRGGVPTARLDGRGDDEHGVVLWGGHLPDPSKVLLLAETAPCQTLAADMQGFPIDHHVIGLVPGQRRRNLVLVFGGEDSLHTQWPRDIADADRSWDLCVSFHGRPADYEQIGLAEFSSLQSGVGRCAAAHAAFAAGSPLWGYERVWFAGGDLSTSWRQIARLFALARENDLLLAQPAFAEGSPIVHGITRQQPGRLLRYTSFVDASAPVFSTDALRLCIPVLQGQQYGTGVDLVWPSRLGASRSRIAIIDGVGVVRARPPAAIGDPDRAARERELLLSAYGVAERIEEFGTIVNWPF